jgi:bisphosphoglycerate-independent phosphoglycerate mutase (AlkP superfamily)
MNIEGSDQNGQKKVLVILVDGFGIAKKNDYNPFDQAKTPFLHSLIVDYPSTVLENKHASDVVKSYYELGLKGKFKSILAKNNISQAYISDSESFALLNFYFNNSKLEKQEKEEQIMVSRPLANDWEEYNADLVKETLKIIKSNDYRFIALSFSILKEVSYLEDLEQAKKAIAALDWDLKKIIKTALDNNYLIILTSVYGQLENLYEPLTESYNLKPTLNPVPLLVVGQEYKGKTFDWPDLEGGDLSTIKPINKLQNLGSTILYLFNIEEGSGERIF